MKSYMIDAAVVAKEYMGIETDGEYNSQTATWEFGVSSNCIDGFDR